MEPAWWMKGMRPINSLWRVIQTYKPKLQLLGKKENPRKQIDRNRQTDRKISNDIRVAAFADLGFGRPFIITHLLIYLVCMCLCVYGSTEHKHNVSVQAES